MLTHALDKLHRKGCDLIVANDVSQPGSGFDADDNEVTLLFADGTMQPRPRLAKAAIADDVVQAAVALHVARS
jgi:phosphopantothenoylcysteine synthetase/decarboxylase